MPGTVLERDGERQILSTEGCTKGNRSRKAGSFLAMLWEVAGMERLSEEMVFLPGLEG